MKQSILVRRREPGVGDIICCSVAVRAAWELHGEDYRVCATFGRQEWVDLFADQGICDEFLPATFARTASEDLVDRFAYIYELDGVDERFHNATAWAPQNRIVIWCTAVDLVPDDLRPAWRPTPEEGEWAEWWLDSVAQLGQRPVVVQWACSPTMRWKNYPHRNELIRLLSEQWPVLVLADRDATDDARPEWESLRAMAAERPGRIRPENALPLRSVGALLDDARLLVCPDSALLHFGAATRTTTIGLFGGTSGDVTCRYYPNVRVLQGPVQPGWNCAKTAPCNGMGIRNFWCHANNHERGECMAAITPQAIMAVAREIVA